MYSISAYESVRLLTPVYSVCFETFILLVFTVNLKKCKDILSWFGLGLLIQELQIRVLASKTHQAQEQAFNEGMEHLSAFVDILFLDIFSWFDLQ